MVLWQRLAVVFLLSLSWAIGLQAAYIFLGPNLKVVAPGHCYRSAQPTPESLESWTRAFGLRTLINLRGENQECDWYRDQVDAVKQLGLTQVDIAVSGKYQPQPQMLRLLVDALDRVAAPILIHCGSGIDRTGLASACYLLLKTDASLDDALGQLHWRHGYFPVGKAARPLSVLLQYRDWLHQEERAHTPEQFRCWVREGYTKED
ncbi:MAG: tyrosine-protein phosphatase [Gemmataceae bacterium]|nr:tyrosine-protein phosphatase [Gemmataceae bacterium]MCI0738214.1 tyrosine-protein phosphatase [Gemmataceae bacterium]